MAASPLVRNVGFLMAASPAGNAAGSTPSKGQSKQRQSAMKQGVQAFGDLIVVWRDASMTLSSHLQALVSILRTLQSVYKASRDSRTLFQHELTRLGLGDLDQAITRKLLIDVEVMWIQMKTMQRRLADSVLAMKFKQDEVQKLVYGQAIDTFTSEPDAIFTTEHMLQINTMFQQYSVELERKTMLLERIFSRNVENTKEITDITFLETLEKAAEQWEDDGVFSCLDITLVEHFLARNNINQGAPASNK